MPTPNCITLDTETGGLDHRINPLMSIAIVLADEALQMMDGFEIKVRPPQDTLIEIPSIGQFGAGYGKRALSGYMNVWTKQRVSLPGECPIINAAAAEVNGYIGPDPTNWDWDAIDRWHAASADVTDAESDIRNYLLQAFGEGDNHVKTVAHNAAFDTKFVDSNMALLARKLQKPWYCTCEASKAYHRKKGLKGSAKLTEMAKLANHDFQGKAHQAFGDGMATLAVLRFLISNGPY